MMKSNMIKTLLFNLPTPINISYWWNFGIMLSIFLMIQIISGLLMSMHYCPSILHALNSIIFINQNINLGWLTHNIHMNGASMFFLCLYIHISRGLYYNSFKLKYTWLLGTTIFLLSMMIAFMGYILPWGQMSFWGATVITNLISSTPYIGTLILEWIWGGFSINNSTLNRFYTLHFLTPFILIILILLHLFFLHLTGSSNPLGLNSNLYKIPFHYYFTLKDLFIILIMILLFMMINLQWPYFLGDPDNFTPANPLSTPTHIKPEWYFLFAYAILRSIPNKMGGVIALLLSITILYLLPLMNFSKMNSSNFYPINQFSFWLFINIFLNLTLLGGLPIEPPYIQLSQFMSILYFMFFFSIYILTFYWNKITFPPHP